jgi:hypothetical protein
VPVHSARKLEPVNDYEVRRRRTGAYFSHVFGVWSVKSSITMRPASSPFIEMSRNALGRDIVDVMIGDEESLSPLPRTEGAVEVNGGEILYVAQVALYFFATSTMNMEVLLLLDLKQYGQNAEHK